MGAAKLTELQALVLRAVSEALPYAIPSELARNLGRQPASVQKSLEALTRRSLVTPIGTYGSGAIYVATAKGKARV